MGDIAPLVPIVGADAHRVAHHPKPRALFKLQVAHAHGGMRAQAQIRNLEVEGNDRDFGDARHNAPDQLLSVMPAALMTCPQRAISATMYLPNSSSVMLGALESPIWVSRS